MNLYAINLGGSGGGGGFNPPGGALGDLLVGNGSGYSAFTTAGGVDGQVLTLDSFQPEGVTWSTPGAVWGAISGTLSNQLDLQAALDNKLNVPATETDRAIVTLDGAGGTRNNTPTITAAGAISLGSVDARIWLDTGTDYSLWRNSANSSIGFQIFAGTSTMNHRWEQSVYSLNDPNGFIVFGLTGTTGTGTIQGADNNAFNDAVSLTVRAGNGAGARAGGDLSCLPGTSGSSDPGAVLLGLASRAAATNGGFPYMPTIAGTPSGTPTSKTGYVPFAFEVSTNKLWVYNGTAWRSVTLT